MKTLCCYCYKIMPKEFFFKENYGPWEPATVAELGSDKLSLSTWRNRVCFPARLGPGKSTTTKNQAEMLIIKADNKIQRDRWQADILV